MLNRAADIHQPNTFAFLFVVFTQPPFFPRLTLKLLSNLEKLTETHTHAAHIAYSFPLLRPFPNCISIIQTQTRSISICYYVIYIFIKSQSTNWLNFPLLSYVEYEMVDSHWQIFMIVGEILPVIFHWIGSWMNTVLAVSFGIFHTSSAVFLLFHMCINRLTLVYMCFITTSFLMILPQNIYFSQSQLPQRFFIFFFFILLCVQCYACDMYTQKN